MLSLFFKAPHQNMDSDQKTNAKIYFDYLNKLNFLKMVNPIFFPIPYMLSSFALKPYLLTPSSISNRKILSPLLSQLTFSLTIMGVLGSTQLMISGYRKFALEKQLNRLDKTLPESDLAALHYDFNAFVGTYLAYQEKARKILINQENRYFPFNSLEEEKYFDKIEDLASKYPHLPSEWLKYMEKTNYSTKYIRPVGSRYIERVLASERSENFPKKWSKYGRKLENKSDYLQGRALNNLEKLNKKYKPLKQQMMANQKRIYEIQGRTIEPNVLSGIFLKDYAKSLDNKNWYANVERQSLQMVLPLLMLWSISLPFSDIQNRFIAKSLPKIASGLVGVNLVAGCASYMAQIMLQHKMDCLSREISIEDLAIFERTKGYYPKLESRLKHEEKLMNKHYQEGEKYDNNHLYDLAIREEQDIGCARTIAKAQKKDDDLRLSELEISTPIVYKPK